jgi:hypothetical protein
MAAQARADLKPGEWRLYCQECGFKHKPELALRSRCSVCYALLYLTSGKVSDQGFKGCQESCPYSV